MANAKKESVLGDLSYQALSTRLPTQSRTRHPPPARGLRMKDFSELHRQWAVIRGHFRQGVSSATMDAHRRDSHAA